MIDNENIGIINIGTKVISDITKGKILPSSYQVGDMCKGEVVDIKKFHPNGEFHIVIKWSISEKMVQYTESMLEECFLIGKIKIDKEFYREEKLKELGI